MAHDTEALTIEHNEPAHRFETHVGPHLAIAEYERDGETITFTHTEVPKAIEGHGVASQLAHAALDYARAEHLTVVPACPFFVTYIQGHKEYANLT